MPQKALAVANYFLDLGETNKAEIDPMKLQKLIYFAHGWCLALADSPLILENVEAWDYGPVIPPVYHNFKKFGRHPVTGRAEKLRFVNLDKNFFESETYKLAGNSDVDQLLDRIWDVYGELSSIQLSNMTHQPGGAWHKTYYELGGEDRRGMDIPEKLIKEEFREKAAQAEGRAAE